MDKDSYFGHSMLTQLDRGVNVYTFHAIAVQLTCVCCLCDMYEVNYPPWTGTTNLYVLLSLHDLCESPSTILCKTKYKMAVLRIFALLNCRLFVHIDLPRRLYGRRCRSLGGLVVIL